MPKSAAEKPTPPFPDTPELQARRAEAPVAQAMIRATRQLIATEGAEWTTTERIHQATVNPKTGEPAGLGAVRYYFGNRERLFLQVARYEHLLQLDRIRNACAKLDAAERLPDLLVELAGDAEHYRVTLGLIAAAEVMPELADVQQDLWADWRANMRAIVGDLQARAIVRSDVDPEALALLWSAITLGLAVHRYAEPGIELGPALELAERYAASLNAPH